MNDERTRNLAKQALTPIINEAPDPPPWDRVLATETSARKPGFNFAIGGLALGVVLAIAVVVLVQRPGGDGAPPLTAPTEQVTTTIQAADVPNTDVPVSEDGVRSEVPATCPVTIPGQNGFVPPTDAPDPLPDFYEAVWYGTPELWTMINPNGSVDDHTWLAGDKTFWWSSNFDELEPGITITGTHLSGSAPSVTFGGPGTNGTHPTLGNFMLVGVQLPEPGCWELKADYKGASLSFVLWFGENSLAGVEKAATAEPNIPTRPTYELDGATYSVTDCPTAPNLIAGGYDAADALPTMGQTDWAKVEADLSTVRDYMVADGGSGVIDVQIIQRNGEVWYPTTGRSLYAVKRVGDYQYEAILAPEASCPSMPYSINGVPVLFNRADR